MVHLTHSTIPVKGSELKIDWHIIDAKGKVLGRVSTEIATLLTGKSKVNYVDYLDSGDEVVVINAKEVIMTGKKMSTKTYDSFSGYPGGLAKVSFERMMDHKPSEIIRHAVSGMLPKNKLRDKRLARLHVFPTAEHTFTDKFTK